ncbi:MAG: alpha/beta hydrolase [Bacteroidota bacterium]
MRIYAFGGLGVDEKVFEHFRIDGDLIVVKWMTPQPKESLSNYVKRLLPEIDTTEPFILLGVSFGGIVAVELSHILRPEKTIIISSITSVKELPVLYRWVGKIDIISWLPDSLLKPPPMIMNWLFGVSKKKDKALLAQIMKDTDTVFLRWASDKIMHWDNRKEPPNLIRIHGDKDHVLPMVKVAEKIILEGGGHFAIVTHTDKINIIINKLIEGLE